MDFTSILDKEKSAYGTEGKPYITDLNLDQIIHRIQAYWPKDITLFYQYFPANEACERYRREIYGDVKKAAVREGLMDFTEQMREREKALKHKARVSMEMQQAIWHLWEVYYYCSAFERLYQKISLSQPDSEGFKAFLAYLEAYLAKEQFIQMKEKCYTYISQLENFHLIITLEDNKVSIHQEEMESSYEHFLKESFSGKRAELRSPFSGNFHLSDFEKELFQIYGRSNAGLFEKISEFSDNYKQYAEEKLLCFYQEIGFYLAFYAFEEKMKAEGFAFTAPQVEPEQEMTASGLYDLALACVNCEQNKEVVSNDMVFHEEERFFVVTGPNQGGKTTFARSLGQLVYFTKMGLDVPARAANVHYFTDILSHFSVEESIETGRGKLLDELERLKPMMADKVENTFIIINELFTTAANYDACIMGKRVLEHFLKQDCRGIYVTHLKELCEGEGIVSLRALTEAAEVFKIIRSEADSQRYAEGVVDRYQLSYEQICERVKKKQEAEEL